MSDITIGLETHIQLDTETKLFCGCPNTDSDEPNTHTCETCLGLPGAKPQTNAKVVEYALRTGLALDCDIAEQVVFSRKTYFYPDMSKNYQITQYEAPVAADGTVSLEDHDIGIKRAHIEEDPAKLVHKGGSMDDATYTLVDYNRAGTPLLEVVTRPDFDAPEQTREYLQKLIRILQYLGVYDPETCAVKSDANISLNGGNRVEIKNITGVRDIADALQTEVERQRRLQENGGTVTQETRNWDAEKQTTTSLRSKESEEDYGYIFDPDLVNLDIPTERVEQVRGELPELPDEKRERFMDAYGVGEELADSLITDSALADAFEDAVEAVGADLAASWFSGPIKKTLNYHELSYSESPLRSEWVVTVLEKLANDEIADNAAETVIREMVDEPRPPEDIIAAEGLEKSGGDELAGWVQEAIDENPEAVEDYESGDESAINFLVGQVMQKSQGSADPKETREQLLEELG